MKQNYGGGGVLAAIAVLVALLAVVPSDATAQTSSYCPLIRPDSIANDSDCDNFNDGAEAFMGTRTLALCPIWSDSVQIGPSTLLYDGWPFDFNGDEIANTVDIGVYAGKLGAQPPSPLYSTRYDLNQNGILNTLDVGKFVPVIGTRCWQLPPYGTPLANVGPQTASSLQTVVLCPLEIILAVPFCPPYNVYWRVRGEAVGRYGNTFFAQEHIEHDVYVFDWENIPFEDDLFVDRFTQIFHDNPTGLGPFGGQVPCVYLVSTDDRVFCSASKEPRVWIDPFYATTGTISGAVGSNILRLSGGSAQVGFTPVP